MLLRRKLRHRSIRPKIVEELLVLRIQNDDNTESVVASSWKWWKFWNLKYFEVTLKIQQKKHTVHGARIFGKIMSNASGESPVKSRLHGRCRRNEMCRSRPKQLAFFCVIHFSIQKKHTTPLSCLQKISKDDKSIDGCAIYFHGRRSYRFFFFSQTCLMPTIDFLHSSPAACIPDSIQGIATGWANCVLA